MMSLFPWFVAVYDQTLVLFLQDEEEIQNVVQKVHQEEASVEVVLPMGGVEGEEVIVGRHMMEPQDCIHYHQNDLCGKQQKK